MLQCHCQLERNNLLASDGPTRSTLGSLEVAQVLRATSYLTGHPESPEDITTCRSAFINPSDSSVIASISCEPSALRLSVFRPWQASSSTSIFADDFIQHSTATQDPVV